MTIDEAIAHAREKAKEQRSHIGTWDEEYSKRCEECAEEHEQLVEWLEELKRFKKDMFSANEQIKDLMSAEADKTLQAYKCGYNKAVDDFVEAVKRRFPYDKNGVFHIELIAEQLKAGGTDEM